jgi:hypothetical protein
MEPSKTFVFKGFDTSGEPVLELYPDGRACLLIAFLPPLNGRDEVKEQEPFYDFGPVITAQTGVQIWQEDREVFWVTNYDDTTADKLAAFFKNFKPWFRDYKKRRAAEPRPPEPFFPARYLKHKLNLYLKKFGFRHPDNGEMFWRRTDEALQAIWTDIIPVPVPLPAALNRIRITVTIQLLSVDRLFGHGNRGISIELPHLLQFAGHEYPGEFPIDNQPACDTFLRYFKSVFPDAILPWLEKYSHLESLRPAIEPGEGAGLPGIELYDPPFYRIILAALLHSSTLQDHIAAYRQEFSEQRSAVRLDALLARLRDAGLPGIPPA